MKLRREVARRRRGSACSHAFALVIPLTTWLTLPGLAHADDREAAAADFREGTAAFARGDHRAAAEAFESAFRRRPHGAAAYNAGLAWQAADDAPRAADAYDTALQNGGLQPGEVTDAERRLRALERSLARVDVTAPPGARVSLAHAEAVAVPARIHVKPGSHELRVVFGDGRSEARPIAVAAGAALPVTFEEPKAVPVPSGPVAASSPPVPADRKRPEPDARGGGGLVPTLGWVALGCGAAAAAAAIGVGTAALDARDEYNATDYTDLDAYDRAGSLRTWANVAWGTSAGFAVAGGVLLIVGLTSSSRSTVAVAVSGHSAALRGTF